MEVWVQWAKRSLTERLLRSGSHRDIKKYARKCANLWPIFISYPFQTWIYSIKGRVCVCILVRYLHTATIWCIDIKVDSSEFCWRGRYSSWRSYTHPSFLTCAGHHNFRDKWCCKSWRYGGVKLGWCCPKQLLDKSFICMAWRSNDLI